MPPLRSAGLVCPISALPSPTGIGGFGPAAEQLVDWMAAAGLKYWQILPLTLPDSRGSPYAPPSLLFGSWLYISPERMPLRWQRGVPQPHVNPLQPVRYHEVAHRQKQWLWKIWRQFSATARLDEGRALSDWRKKHIWVEAAARYFAWKDRFHQQPWWTWPKAIRPHRPFPDQRLERRKEFYVWLGWVFERQWNGLKQYANRRGIRIVGDLPFYSPLDSVEVWSHPEYFHLNARRQPTAVAGVPPDPFSSGGQRWGNPVYAWPVHRRNHFALWIERLGLAQARSDAVRLDHFQGYVHTWHIPARSTNPGRGRWVPSPGPEMFRRVRTQFPRLRFVAEDLGRSDPAVQDFRQKIRLPGTRVWLFGWSGLPNNIHAVDAISRDTWFYTSTHDTNTVRGWWETESRRYERKHVRERTGAAYDVAGMAVRQVIRSKASVAMLTIPDILGLGAPARFNRPGTSRGNWAWRFDTKKLTQPLAREIRRLLKQT